MGIDKRLIAQATKRWIAIGVVAGVFSVLLTMALVTIIGVTIDAALNGRFVFGDWLAGLLLILVTKGFLGWMGRLGQYHASSETKLTVRDMMYAHALKLGPGILGRKRTGELVNTAVDGMEWLELFFGVYYVQFLVGMLTPLLLCIYIFIVDWVVGFAVLISIPLTPIFLGMFSKNFRGVSERYREMNSYLSAQFLDSLQGMATLKLFNQGKPRGQRIHRETEKNRVETMRLLMVNQIMILFTDWGFALATTVVMTVVALLRMRAGFVSPGEVVALVLLSSEFARPLNLIGAFFFAGAIGREVAKKIGDFLEEETAVFDNPSAGAPQMFTPSIRFENVQFSYEGSYRPALDGVSFVVNSGETVALVGQSGSGKTTITNLLMRLFTQQEGKIELGGQAIEAYPLDWVRSQIALVPQNPYLFYGTFADNLRIARADATMEEMAAAAKAANIHEFIINSPEGYDTMIGEQGMSLSGGQAQRLAIARAMIEQAPIVVLDEPTSQIDVENERVIQEAIDHLTQDRTVIIIAHRLSTVEQADRLVVLDHGRVVETGTRDELLAQKGAFAQMVATHDAVLEGV